MAAQASTANTNGSADKYLIGLAQQEVLRDTLLQDFPEPNQSHCKWTFQVVQIQASIPILLKLH
jgi:hypothetical protein